MAFRSVSLSSTPFDVSFRPGGSSGGAATTRDDVAFVAAEIDGSCELVMVNSDMRWRVNVAREEANACRCVRFASSDMIVAGAADGVLSCIDPRTGVVTATREEAHDAPINRIEALGGAGGGASTSTSSSSSSRGTGGSGAWVASGDDEGVVRIWDFRQPDPLTASFRHHDDFIADLCYDALRPCLLVASGDGTLSVIDVRFPTLSQREEQQRRSELLHRTNNKKKKKKNKGKQQNGNADETKSTLRARSENTEDELLSVVCMKSGRKVRRQQRRRQWYFPALAYKSAQERAHVHSV